MFYSNYIILQINISKYKKYQKYNYQSKPLTTPKLTKIEAYYNSSNNSKSKLKKRSSNIQLKEAIQYSKIITYNIVAFAIYINKRIKKETRAKKV